MKKKTEPQKSLRDITKELIPQVFWFTYLTAVIFYMWKNW